MLSLPVHPAVVHFPVAMLTAAWVAIVGAHGLGRPTWRQWATGVQMIGVATLPVAIVAGFVDLNGFDAVVHPRWDQPLIWHVVVSLAVTGLFGSHAWWSRGRDLFEVRVARVDIAWATAAVWALVATSLIASEMVYG